MEQGTKRVLTNVSRETLKQYNRNKKRRKNMEKRFETKHVYRVWTFGAFETEAFFTQKSEAIRYTEMLNELAGKEVAVMNRWQWEMKIEK